MKIKRLVKSTFLGALIVTGANLFSPISIGAGSGDVTICGGTVFIINTGHNGPDGLFGWACYWSGIYFEGDPYGNGWYDLQDRDFSVLFYSDESRTCLYSCTPITFDDDYVNPPIT
jgi:hypothetical protein